MYGKQKQNLAWNYRGFHMISQRRQTLVDGMSNVQSHPFVGCTSAARLKTRSEILKLEAFEVLANACNHCCTDGHSVGVVERSKSLKWQIGYHNRYVHVNLKDGRRVEVDYRWSRHVERWMSCWHLEQKKSRLTVKEEMSEQSQLSDASPPLSEHSQLSDASPPLSEQSQLSDASPLLSEQSIVRCLSPIVRAESIVRCLSSIVRAESIVHHLSLSFQSSEYHKVDLIIITWALYLFDVLNGATHSGFASKCSS